jgi:hypothetical protein
MSRFSLKMKVTWGGASRTSQAAKAARYSDPLETEHNRLNLTPTLAEESISSYLPHTFSA